MWAILSITLPISTIYIFKNSSLVLKFATCFVLALSFNGSQTKMPYYRLVTVAEPNPDILSGRGTHRLGVPAQGN
jgi:hypothetical protein